MLILYHVNFKKAYGTQIVGLRIMVFGQILMTEYYLNIRIIGSKQQIVVKSHFLA